MAFHQNSRGRRAQLVFDFSLIEQIQTYTQFEVTLFGSSNAGNVAYFTVVPQGKQPINYNATNNTATFVTSHDLSGTYSYTAYATDILGYTSEIVLKSIKVINSDTDVFYINPNTITRPCISDSSVNNFEITPTGDVKPSTFNPYLSSWSVQFDGNGDYLTLPNSTAFDLSSRTFTIEAWVYQRKNTDAAVYSYIVDKRDRAGTGGGTWGFLLDSGKPALMYGSGMAQVNGTTAIPLNTWTHIAASVNLGTVKIFINGVETYTTTGLTFPAGTAELWIGRPNEYPNYFDGYISNLRIVKGTSLYNSNFTPSTSPLTVVPGTILLTCQDSKFVDNSPNRFTVSKVGDSQITPFNPFTTDTISTPITHSVYFNGTTDYLISPTVADPTGNFTIEFWWNPTSLSGTQGVFTKGAGIQIYSKGNTIYAAFSANNSLTYFAHVAFGSLTSNNWNHIAVVKNGTSYTGYLNGVGVSLVTTSILPNTGGTPCVIGAYSNGSSTSYFSTGYISNVRYVTTTAIYTSNFTPSTVPLTAISGTSLLTCQDSTLIDNSTNAFTITSVGKAQPSPINPFGATTSSYSPTYSSALTAPNTSSAYFGGSGYYLSVPSSTAFALGTSYTIELWHYRTGTASAGSYISVMQLVNTQPYGSQLTGFMLTYDGGGVFNFRDSTGSIILSYSSTNLALNTWYHVAIVRNGSGTNNMTMYINGVGVVSGTSSGTQAKAVPVYIGGDSNGNCSFPGYISNFRIVKGTAVYTANFTPSTTPLTAITNTSLLTCQNASFIDNSTNNFTITVNGNTTIYRANPFGFTSAGTSTLTKGSAYFDGSGDYLISNNPDLAFGTGDFTVECWIYALAANDQAIYEGRLKNSNSTGFTLTAFNSTTIRTYSSSVLLTATVSNYIGTWTHIAVTRSSGISRLFVNGILGQSAASTTNFTDDRAIIGAGMYSTIVSAAFNGFISNFRIIKGTAAYTANFIPSTKPLTTTNNTVLLTCQNSNPHNNHTFVNSATNTSNLVITRNGNVTQGSLSPYSANWCGHFATGQCISTPPSSEFAFGTGDFTVECWLNPLAQTGVNIIQASTSNSWGLITFGSQVYWQQDGGNFGAAAGSIPLNTWSHIAITRSSGTLRRFLNGVLLNSATDNFNYSSTSSRQIGHTGGGAPFQLSNVRIVKGTAIYTANFTPPTSTLTAVAGTALLILQNDQFIDNSSNRFALTTTGTPTTTLNNISSFALNTLPTPKTYSTYFGGNGDYLSISNNAAFQLGTGDFTIEFWWNGSPTGSYSQNIGTLITGTEQGTWRVGTRFNSTNSIYFSVGKGSGFTEVNYSTNVNDNVWHHIACVRISGVISMFVDGIKRSPNGSENISETCTSSNELKIGYNQRDRSYIAGYMSNVRVVKGTAVYTANFIPVTSPLTTNSGTTLLTCQNSTFIDNSTNNFTISSFGRAKPSAINPFGSTSITANGYTVSKFKGSAYFDGTGDYLTVTNPPTILREWWKSPFTIEAWVYVNSFNQSAGAQPTMVGNMSPTSDGNYWSFGPITNGTIKFYYWTGSGVSVSTTTAIETKQWCHLAVVHVNSQIRIYINGVLSVTSTISGTPLSVAETPLTVGTLSNSSINGYISDLRITTRALYSSNFLPSSEPLTAAVNTTLLLGFSDSVIVDSIGNHMIETAGDVRISTVKTKSGTTTMYFDGSGDSLIIQPSKVLAPLTGNFTYECWVYPVTTQRIYRMIFGLDSYVSNAPFRLYQYGDVFTLWYNNSNSITSTPITINNWYHVAMTRTGTSLRLFINGTQVGTTVLNNTVSYPPSIFRVGNDAAGSYPFVGYISDLRITHSSRYASNFTPPNALIYKQ